MTRMYVRYLGIVVESSAVNMLLVVTTSSEEAQWIEVIMSRLSTGRNQIAGIKQFRRQVGDRLV